MIYETFQRNNLGLADRKLVIGVSGGVDSIVLLHLCYRLGAQLSVVHVNYGLRGDDSDSDEKFTREFCERLDIPCFVTQVNASELIGEGINLQQKARVIRYQAYHDCLASTESDYILTAHHKDDSVETTVINFFRGTNITGLTGIKDHDLIKRPLLAFTKSEILDYAQVNSIKHREDKSNATDYYTRNHIRNTVLPQLEETFPNIQKRLNTTIENLRAIEVSHQIAMDSYLSKAIKESGCDRILPFRYFEDRLEEQVLIYWGSQYGMSRAQMQNLYSIRDRVGKRVESSDYQIIIDRSGYLLVSKKEDSTFDFLLIEEKGFEAALPYYESILTDDSTLGENASHSIHLNPEMLVFPLTIRTWKAGDRIQYNQTPTLSKKLKKLFNDHKVKSTDKHRIPILINGDDTIIWVVGLQMNPVYLKKRGYSIYLIRND